MPDRRPIQFHKQTLAGVAAEALREAILDGRLKPGEWLRQEALAEEMGVSQITVRDALNQLVGEGMAVRVPYKGVRVVSLDVGDIENICVMRGLLEGLAAELAAENITPEELDQMLLHKFHKLVKRVRILHRLTHPEKFRYFVRTITAETGNGRLGTHDTSIGDKKVGHTLNKARHALHKHPMSTSRL